MHSHCLWLTQSMLIHSPYNFFLSFSRVRAYIQLQSQRFFYVSLSLRSTIIKIEYFFVLFLLSIKNCHNLSNGNFNRYIVLLALHVFNLLLLLFHLHLSQSPWIRSSSFPSTIQLSSMHEGKKRIFFRFIHAEHPVEGVIKCVSSLFPSWNIVKVSCFMYIWMFMRGVRYRIVTIAKK